MSVQCNELGDYTVYQTDERGFNNPEGTWKKQIDIALLGDSFAQGSCVNPEQNVAGVLRETYPGVINLGMAGNGPLSELAGLSEFLPVVKPHYVVWMYYEENDLYQDGLELEKTDPVLKQYLKKGYRQGLTELQAEIDAFMKYYVNHDQTLRAAVTNASIFWSIFKMRELRARVHQLPSFISTEKESAAKYKSAVTQPGKADLTLFEYILEQAKARTEDWGGELIFVYLPAWERYVPSQPVNADHDQVLTIIKQLGIKMVDFDQVLRGSGDPLRYFPFRSQGHYTAAGYRLLADTIRSRLENSRLAIAGSVK